VRSTRIYHQTYDPLDLPGAFHGLMRCAIPACREDGGDSRRLRVDDDDDPIYVDLSQLRFATLPFQDHPAAIAAPEVRSEGDRRRGGRHVG
jgi:hypothetical protein